MNYMITVFTPTYNRAYILNDLYQSLLRQTFSNFEWLIIDDGSIDNTEKLVTKWIEEEHNFLIKYYKVENGGKCRAINKALDLAKGELFFTVDSDDYLTDDAIEKITKWFKNIDPNGKIKGVAANKGYTKDKTNNNIFNYNYLDKSLLDIYSYRENGRQVFDGERAFIFYTDFHKKYKYPEFENENFMTEAVVWNRMAIDGYLMRFYNDIIWIFEYKEDGLTKAGHSLFINNPRGYGLWVKEKCYFTTNRFFDHFRMYYSYYCDLVNQYKSKEIKKYINMPLIYFLLCIFFKKIKQIV